LVLFVIPEYSRHPWRSRFAPPQPAPDVIRGRSRLQSCKRSRETIPGLRRQYAKANIGAADGPEDEPQCLSRT